MTDHVDYVPILRNLSQAVVDSMTTDEWNAYQFCDWEWL